MLRRDDNTLRAYNAEDLALLWQSNQVAGDSLGGQVVKAIDLGIAGAPVHYPRLPA